VGDSAERPHRAGHDDHAVIAPGAGGEGRVKILLCIEGKGVVPVGFVAQFGLPDLFCVGGHDDGEGLPLLLQGSELVEEELGVEGAAGAGDGNDNFGHSNSFKGKYVNAKIL